jgi:hypothetical protein
LTTPAETLTRLADAVVAWHELLVELATDARGRFAAAAPVITDFTGDPPAWRAVQGRGRTTIYGGFPHPRDLPHPSALSWADVDPDGRALDRESVAAVVADLVATFEPPAQGSDWRLRDLWLENVTAPGWSTATAFGRWAGPGRWARPISTAARSALAAASARGVGRRDHGPPGRR